MTFIRLLTTNAKLVRSLNFLQPRRPIDNATESTGGEQNTELTDTYDSVAEKLETSTASQVSDGVSLLDQPVSREDVFDLFRLVLRREYDSPYAERVIKDKSTLRGLLSGMLDSEEFKALAPAQAGERESALNDPVTAEDVHDLFRIVLRREYGNNNSFLNWLVERRVPVRNLLKNMLVSEEFIALQDRLSKERNDLRNDLSGIDGPTYRTPKDLEVTSGNKHNILLIGSCLLDDWKGYLSEGDNGVSVERIVFNNASQLPDLGPSEAAKFSYQICGLNFYD